MGTNSTDDSHFESDSINAKGKLNRVLVIYMIALSVVILVSLAIGSFEFNPYVFVYLAVGSYLVSRRTFTISTRGWASKHYELGEVVYVSSLFFLGPIWVIPATLISGLFEVILEKLPLRFFFINFASLSLTFTSVALIVGAPLENLTVLDLILIPVTSILFMLNSEIGLNYLVFRNSEQKSRHTPLHIQFPLQIVIPLALVGVFFGISIGYSYHIRPWISVSFAVVFFAILILIEKINKLQNETEKLQLFSEFIDVDEKFKTLKEVEEHIIQIAKTVTKRQDITIDNIAPTQSELGRKITAQNHPNIWIKAPTQGCSQYTIKNNERDLDIVAILGERAIEKYLLNENLNTQALKDPLTGLANRRAFDTLLEHEIASVKRQHGTISILYIDLDGFKPINDTYGHKAGDTVLISIARRLSKIMRDQDCVSRHGGDEFVILTKNIEQKHLDDLAQRILTEIEKPISINDKKEIPHIVTVSASIGIASAPYNTIDQETLLQQADENMYHTKQTHKNNNHINTNKIEKTA